MVVSVKFVGSFRGISGKDKLTLKFGRSVSLTALVKKTVEQLPKLRSSLIDPESGEPRRSMLGAREWKGNQCFERFGDACE